MEGDPPWIRIPRLADTFHRVGLEPDLGYDYIICSKFERISDRQGFPHVDTSFLMAGVPGFEPGLPDPKSDQAPFRLSFADADLRRKSLWHIAFRKIWNVI